MRNIVSFLFALLLLSCSTSKGIWGKLEPKYVDIRNYNKYKDYLLKRNGNFIACYPNYSLEERFAQICSFTESEVQIFIFVDGKIITRTEPFDVDNKFEGATEEERKAATDYFFDFIFSGFYALDFGYVLDFDITIDETNYKLEHSLLIDDSFLTAELENRFAKFIQEMIVKYQRPQIKAGVKSLRAFSYSYHEQGYGK